MKLILPKIYYAPEYITFPFFFLAGPVKGGADWQYHCARLIEAQMGPEFTVAIPCRYTELHPLYNHRVAGLEDIFPRQTLWERFYLRLASQTGCIIFWLPEESKVAPRDDGSPYARDTYGELGEWRGRLMHVKKTETCNVVIGAEDNFPGLSVIEANFTAVGQTVRPSIRTVVPIINFSMEETVREAITKAKKIHCL